MSKGNENKINRVEIEVPNYLLLSEEALNDGEVDYQSKSKITILDGHKENHLDLGKDQVFLNGTELSVANQREVFRRLGIDKPQTMVLDFTQAYFGSLSKVSERVAQGKFTTVDEIDDALTPDDEAGFRKLQAYTQYAGINRSTDSRARIKAAAYAVAETRAQQEESKQARLKKAWREVRILCYKGEKEYWVASKRLREAYLKYGMKTEIDALFALDKRAYAKPTLRAAIPKATEEYLAAIGKIHVAAAPEKTK